MFKKRVILITGGTGTFGNEIVRRLLKTDIAEIRIFSRDELKQESMRNEIGDARVKFFIGDIRDADSLLLPMRGVDYVFHAAALKQVPSCEFFPLEAIRTNVLGAENVFTAALQSGVKNVVALSTDKAVYPIGVMGLSKSLMEKIMISKSRMPGLDTVFCGTRYGNVLASRGSVVPLFVDQILSGQPRTITDPDMTRFMMTIEEAIDLVLYAFRNSESGDIFVKKNSAITILTIVEALEEIFKVVNRIKIIGIRHGEKLHETLLTKEEVSRAEDCGNYYRIPADTRDLNYSLFAGDNKKHSDFSDYASNNIRLITLAEAVDLFKQLPYIRQALLRREQ